MCRHTYRSTCRRARWYTRRHTCRHHAPSYNAVEHLVSHAIMHVAMRLFVSACSLHARTVQAGTPASRVPLLSPLLPHSHFSRLQPCMCARTRMRTRSLAHSLSRAAPHRAASRCTTLGSSVFIGLPIVLEHANLQLKVLFIAPVSSFFFPPQPVV